jgi:hypothetical protein
MGLRGLIEDNSSLEQTNELCDPNLLSCVSQSCFLAYMPHLLLHTVQQISIMHLILL